MNIIKTFTARVKSVEDDYTITFEIPNIYMNADVFPSATPIFNKVRQTYVGDEVLIWQLNADLDDFLYMPYNIDGNFTGLKFNNCYVDISDGANVSIKVATNVEPEKEEDKGKQMEIDKILSEITIKSDSIVVQSNDDQGEMQSSISIDNSGAIEINGLTSTKINPGSSGTLEMKGDVTPDGTGFMCGIKNCLFTGAPHVGSKAVNNEGINLS